jgi:signal transduction histidine kinase
MAIVLIVEDEENVRFTLRACLEEAGHKVFDVSGVAEANQCVDRQLLDVALLDIRLPNGSGLDVVRHIRDRQPDVRSILMTAEPNFESASQAVSLRVFDYLVKPFDRKRVVSLVAEAWLAKAAAKDYALRLEERSQFAEELEHQVSARTAELSQSAANLHALAARLHVVREEERKSLARELHDEFGQNLTALQIDLEWLGRHLRTDRPLVVAPLQDRIAAMAPLAKRLTEMTQTVCSALRPGMLDDLGLAAAIEWQAEDCQKRTGLTCTVAIPDECQVLDPDLALALFRILQESLTNVVRHAQATHVDINLHVAAGELLMEVRDNGRGFVPESLSGVQTLGLLSMRERSSGFGGSVVFLSEPGKGTTVRVRIPHAQGTL